jgi:hypothetical protein
MDYLQMVINAISFHHIFRLNATDTISYPSLDFWWSIFSTPLFKVSVDQLAEIFAIEYVLILIIFC